MKTKFHILYLALAGAIIVYYQKIAPTISTKTITVEVPVKGKTDSYVPKQVEPPKPKTIFKKIFV